jgi:hypothetical protein
MKGSVLLQILAEVYDWTGRKAWTGPGNTVRRERGREDMFLQIWLLGE